MKPGLSELKRAWMGRLSQLERVILQFLQWIVTVGVKTAAN
jgi:hypothetical protein